MGKFHGKGLLLAGTVAAGLILGSAAAFAVKFSLLENRKSISGEIEDNPPLQNEIELAPVEQDIVRVLVCGIDDTLQLTDVILYGVFNAAEGTANILQIPRDSYVGEDYPTGKINAVYSHPQTFESGEGIKELEMVVERQLKLPVDYYATITLESFRGIIDDLGGVTVQVPQVIEYLPGKVLYPGEQTLNGEQAEWLVRYRKGYASGDIGRMNMQTAFLKALIPTVKSQGKLNALNLLIKHYGDVKTDMPLSKMLSYAGEAYRLESEDISFYMAPGIGVMNRSYAVYQLDAYKLADLLNEAFRPGEQPVPAESLGIRQVPPQLPEEGKQEEPEELPGGDIWQEFLESLPSQSGEEENWEQDENFQETEHQEESSSLPWHSQLFSE